MEAVFLKFFAGFFVLPVFGGFKSPAFFFAGVFLRTTVAADGAASAFFVRSVPDLLFLLLADVSSLMAAALAGFFFLSVTVPTPEPLTDFAAADFFFFPASAAFLLGGCFTVFAVFVGFMIVRAIFYQISGNKCSPKEA
jgi:hypothetical protein